VNKDDKNNVELRKQLLTELEAGKVATWRIKYERVTTCKTEESA
jgi:hypothetical protein